MTSQIFVGIDVGSASVLTSIFDGKSQRLAFALPVIEQFHPRPLYVEQSSVGIWEQTCAAMREAAADMVRPGESVTARPQTKAFHDAKYAVYLPLYQDMEPCRSAKSAWQ